MQLTLETLRSSSFTVFLLSSIYVLVVCIFRYFYLKKFKDEKVSKSKNFIAKFSVISLCIVLDILMIITTYLALTNTKASINLLIFNILCIAIHAGVIIGARYVFRDENMTIKSYFNYYIRFLWFAIVVYTIYTGFIY